MPFLFEIDTSTPGGIFQLIGGILCIPIVIYLFRVAFGYIFGGMAKLSNKRFVRHGRTIADPDTIDVLNEDLKQKALAVKKGVVQTKEYVKKQIHSHKEKNFSTKMEEIGRLKDDGTISEQEYSNLRSEILKKHYS